jgi:hypothetical protein
MDQFSQNELELAVSFHECDRLRASPERSMVILTIEHL